MEIKMMAWLPSDYYSSGRIIDYLGPGSFINIAFLSSPGRMPVGGRAPS